MNESASRPNAVEALAEEFLQRRRLGQRPTIAEYTAKYPELAEEIRACFPALLLVENLKPDAADVTGPATAAAGPGAGLPGGRLGDYQILREVGRGGMGVVYEAAQLSLGRHVALKVLPAQALLDPRHLQRFQREARAAARLHHTNIVPVFGVGECDGLHYYVMQFIHGLGLDQVLDELNRLRQGRNRTAEANCPAATEPVPIGQVAQALLTGRFSVSPAQAPAEQTTESPAALAVAPSTSDSTTAVHLPGQAEHSSLSGSGRGYWQGVARIGVQVAEALAHAHGQGILHRDIKPSNLLLDTHGTVWVTDFGLAKADDGDGLTQTGDIVGTLRYMAPERFGGQSDPRSDLYGLGVTLYELLTLRPAFAESDHHKLLQRVLHDEPPRPRKLNPEVPRDLETIVLKAIAREPRKRYTSAAEMAEDLRRFLADRPVKARRASALERLWRWVGRNPALAAALGAVALLLFTVAVGAFLFAWGTGRQLQETRQARDEATVRLYRSLVQQARASRRSRGIGQRLDSLATLEQATRLARQLRLPEQDFLELRNEVIACLALPDVRVAREWDGWPDGTNQVHFDDQLERYARVDGQGNVTVRRVADDAEICHFPSGIGGCFTFLSPDGRFLWAGNAPRGKVWDVAGHEPRAILHPGPVVSHAFSPDSRRVALGHPDGSISLYDLPSGRPLRRLDPGPVVNGLAFHPNGRQLALTGHGLIQVRDVETGKVFAEFRHPTGFWNVAWHPDGKTLAAAGGDRIIHLWDVATGKPTVRLEGFKNGGIAFTFNRAGDLLASNGWEGTLRLWDPRTGQQLFQVRANWGGAGPRFGPDDRLLGGTVKDNKLRLWEVAASRAYRTLVRDPALGKGNYSTCAVSPKVRLLVAGMADGFGFWDGRTGAPLDFVPFNNPAYHVVFQASGALVTDGSGGLFRWPVRPDPASAGLVRIGPPQRLPLPGAGLPEFACSPDGRVVASAQFWGALVWHRDRPEERIRLTPHDEARSVSVSPDGRWVATGSHGQGGAKVWDAATGRFVKDLMPTQPFVNVRFSPDGKWLATAGGVCRLWAVESWQEGPSLGVTSGAVAFSADGKLLAVETGQNTVRLLDPDTGREYARLEDSNQDRAWIMAFSPDGTQLVVNGESQSLHVWDLRAIRAELARRGLDWDLPSYPPAVEPPEAPPLRVRVDTAGLTDPRVEVAAATLALALLPINPEASLRRGRARLRLRDYPRAADDLGVALGLNPDNSNPAAWSEWALACSFCGRFGPAAAAYGRAIELDPEDALARNNLAWLLATCPDARLRDPARAVGLAKRAVDLAPGDSNAWNTLGVAHYRAGDWQAAIDSLTKAVELQGGGTAFDFFFLALAHGRRGEKETARKWFDQAVPWMDKNAPQDEELRRFRAEAAELLGVKDVKK
jgi:WD40 repeat protein/serine/threonine protein kinase/Flp pilus assembly protein TadD